MLASDFRLKGEGDFEKVKKNGYLYQSAYFGIAVSKRSDNENSRFGFVVSTKVSKHASQRNRIKRALSEAVRYNLTTIPKGYDVVFLGKKIIEKKSTEEIMAETRRCLSDKNLFK